MPLQELLIRHRILPVLIVETAEAVLPVVDALAAGGIHAVEITLRTPAAIASIKAVRQFRPDITVAAGTVRTRADLAAVAEAGVAFAVSPGFTPALAAAAKQLGVPLLPGVCTPSEILAGIESGYECFKLFPAEAIGGQALLKAFASPFAGINFCPTGGIGPQNFLDYLALSNVLCVGGSWMVDSTLVRQERWNSIEQLSRECVERIRGAGLHADAAIGNSSAGDTGQRL